MSEDNSVFIGRKPAMNYVLAVVTQFNKGSTSVIVKARGKSISRAVDVVEIVRHRFITNLLIDDIAIDTESLMLDNKSVNVSSIEITVSKKKEERKPMQRIEKPVDVPQKKPAEPPAISEPVPEPQSDALAGPESQPEQ